jgi:hypothetical protein
MQNEGVTRLCEYCNNPAGDGPCEVCDKRWLDGNAESFKAMCAKEVTIHSAKRYRFNEATQAFDEVDDATVQDFLQTHPVGTVWREYVAAPGAGFTDYRVTRYTAGTVYGVQIRSTVRELTAEEAR